MGGRVLQGRRTTLRRRAAAVAVTAAALGAAGCASAPAHRASPPDQVAPAPSAAPVAAVVAPAPAVAVPAASVAPRAPLPPATVATALGTLTVFHSTTGAPYERLARRTKFGSPRVLLVTGTRPGWVRALLPERPNGAQGWVPAAQVVVTPTPYRVEVSRRTHRLAVFRGDRQLFRAPVVTGAAGTPTPGGTFYVTDVLPVGADQPAYGPFALALSGYSPTLTTFAGSDAEVALHGTNEPWLLGQSASHGCIRMGNAVVTRLARLLPLGTPVVVT